MKAQVSGGLKEEVVLQKEVTLEELAPSFGTGSLDLPALTAKIIFLDLLFNPR